MKPYQSDRRCLNTFVYLNQGTRKVGLLTLKINPDRSPFHIKKALAILERRRLTKEGYDALGDWVNQSKKEGWAGFSEGWHGCSEGFPDGEARGKS